MWDQRQIITKVHVMWSFGPGTYSQVTTSWYSYVLKYWGLSSEWSLHTGPVITRGLTVGTWSPISWHARWHHFWRQLCEISKKLTRHIKTSSLLKQFAALISPWVIHYAHAKSYYEHLNTAIPRNVNCNWELSTPEREGRTLGIGPRRDSLLLT